MQHTSINSKESSILAGCSHISDPFHQAVALQVAAAKVNFDWPQVEAVLKKVAEELAELKQALSAGQNSEAVEEELGDLLFACVNLARLLDKNPGQALSQANEKFANRFRRMESNLHAQGIPLDACTEQRWEQEWQRAKRECP